MWAKSVILSLLITGPALALAEPADSPRELRFAIIDDVPSTTLAAEVLAAAYADINISIATRKVPSRRALMMADVGQVDGDLFRIAEVGDRYPNLIRVPYPLLKGKLHAVSKLPDNSLHPTINGRKARVAVRRGIVIAEKTAEELGMVPVHADSYQQMQAMLDWGRVDLALVSSVDGFSPLDEQRWEHLYILSEPVTEFNLYHYLHRRHAELAEPLAKALKELELSGEKTRIAERLRKTFNVADTLHEMAEGKDREKRP